MLVNFQSIVKCCREKKRILVWTDHSTTWIEMEATSTNMLQGSQLISLLINVIAER